MRGRSLTATARAISVETFAMDAVAFHPPEGFRPVRDPGGFMDLVGPLYYRKESAGYCFGFQAEERHANPRGVIHGGMMMTVLDQVLGGLVYFSIDRKPCATVSLTCDFVSFATPGDWLEARTRMKRRGRSLVFVEGEITCGDRLVMTASGIWKVLGA